MYQLDLISTAVAEQISSVLPGIPTENRVLILSPKNLHSTKSGIIIPGQVKEGVPRKGVIVKKGLISDEYKNYDTILDIGHVVTYGMYAGKELEFDTSTMDESLVSIIENSVFTVLTVNEIIYIEPNNVNNDESEN